MSMLCVVAPQPLQPRPNLAISQSVRRKLTQARSNPFQDHLLTSNQESISVSYKIPRSNLHAQVSIAIIVQIALLKILVIVSNILGHEQANEKLGCHER